MVQTMRATSGAATQRIQLAPRYVGVHAAVPTRKIPCRPKNSRCQ